jgi:hypothetical protein
MTAVFGFVGVPAASAATSSGAADQVVDYHGYEIQVPASWPVYNLAADPTRCVLFNQHAVYLGTPGTEQNCPDRAFGRTEAVLVQPEQTSLPPGTVTLGTGTASFSSALSAVETTSHTVQLAAPGPGVQIEATYGTDEARIRSILAGAQITATASASPSSTPTAKAAPSTSSAPTTKSTTKSTAHAGPIAPELSELQGQGTGIDTCTVPTVSTGSRRRIA